MEITEELLQTNLEGLHLGIMQAKKDVLKALKANNTDKFSYDRVKKQEVQTKGLTYTKSIRKAVKCAMCTDKLEVGSSCLTKQLTIYNYKVRKTIRRYEKVCVPCGIAVIQEQVDYIDALMEQLGI